MSIIKKIVKLSLFFTILFIITYGGLYLCAWLSPRLTIDKANKLYFYDQDNKLFPSASDNDWINLQDISPHLINATISIEDKRFYTHYGFDYLRIIKSLYVNFVNQKNLQCRGYPVSRLWESNHILHCRDYKKTE